MLRIESGVWSVHERDSWRAGAGLFCDHSVFGEDTSVLAVAWRRASRGALSTWSAQIAGGTGIATTTS